MTLYEVIGDLGSGKTIFSTKMAYHETRPVYANYKIDIKNYHPLKPETLFKLNQPSLVLIDEAYTWIESRGSSGKSINKYMSHILFQSRKREIDFILTNQLMSTIDVRFRMMTNFEIHCRQVAGVGFQYTIFKLSGFKRYSPLTLVMPYSEAEKIYPLYNSWELISAIDDEMLFNITQDKTEIVADIDKVVAYLLEQSDARTYTKGIVADYCLRNGYPKSYVDMIYNAIKASILKVRSLPKLEPVERKPYRLRG